MNKLQIGSGRETERLKKNGWVTLDSDPNVRADITAKAYPLPPEVQAVEWARIELIHVIEHLYRDEAEKLLESVLGVLEAGGVLVLEAPNIERAAEYLLGIRKKSKRHPGIFYDMYAFYGDQNGNRSYQHLWGWTPETLKAACVKAGFREENVHILPAQHHWEWRDFRVEAYKDG